MFAASPTGRTTAPGEEFAKGHYEQLVRRRDDPRRRQSGRSPARAARPLVGPAILQAPWYIPLAHRQRRSRFGFMASRVAKQDGAGTRGGFVWEDGAMHLCRRRRDHDRDQG
jgi:hypothetical protein